MSKTLPKWWCNRCSRPYSQLTVINVRHMHYLSQRKMPETLTRSKEMHKTLSLSKTIEIKGKLRNSFEIMGMISELISRMLIAPSVRMTDSPRHQTRHTRPTQSWKLVHDRKVWSPWRLHTTLSVFQLIRICNRVLGTNISERRHRYSSSQNVVKLRLPTYTV